VTSWIENKANELLGMKLEGVRRMPYDQARKLATTRKHDYLHTYVDDLPSVLDLDAIRASGVHMGVDPLGGAGVHYWPLIADQYKLDLTITNDAVDPTFRFMTLDWDGKIRMDPSSPNAMQRLIGLKERYDIAFACDTDHDRHGVVTRSAGLMPPNHYLTAAAHYLFSNRPKWSANATIAKTVVTSMMLDKVAAQLGRKIYETPVGFKWFVDGLVDGSLGFVCEESAGLLCCVAMAACGPPTRTVSFWHCWPVRSRRAPARILPGCTRTSPRRSEIRLTNGWMHQPMPRSARPCRSCPVSR